MPVELAGAERIGRPAYDIEELKASRSYFKKEPKTNIDRIACPAGLWEHLWAISVREFGTAVTASLAGTLGEAVRSEFFVLHDTAGTGEWGDQAGQEDPRAKGSTAGIHLWLSPETTYRQRDWSQRGYGTKMESGAANRWFLHVELSRDKKLLKSATYYNDSQYERLALAYLFACARKGMFLTVTSHNEIDRACCIYDDSKKKFLDFGHHDPERFDLARWYQIVAKYADVPVESTFGIQPARVNGKNQGGQKNVFIGFIMGRTDGVDQYGPVAYSRPSNSDAALYDKIRHPTYGEYYDLPVTVRLASGRVLPRDA